MSILRLSERGNFTVYWRTLEYTSTSLQQVDISDGVNCLFDLSDTPLNNIPNQPQPNSLAYPWHSKPMLKK